MSYDRQTRLVRTFPRAVKNAAHVAGEQIADLALQSPDLEISTKADFSTHLMDVLACLALGNPFGTPEENLDLFVQRARAALAKVQS